MIWTLLEPCGSVVRTYETGGCQLGVSVLLLLSYHIPRHLVRLPLGKVLARPVCVSITNNTESALSIGGLPEKRIGQMYD